MADNLKTEIMLLREKLSKVARIAETEEEQKKADSLAREEISVGDQVAKIVNEVKDTEVQSEINEGKTSNETQNKNEEIITQNSAERNTTSSESMGTNNTSVKESGVTEESKNEQGAQEAASNQGAGDSSGSVAVATVNEEELPEGALGDGATGLLSLNGKSEKNKEKTRKYKKKMSKQFVLFFL